MPVIRKDEIDKNPKDIDSDNLEQSSNDELTVPVPLRGSYMSSKSKHEES